MAEDFDTLSSVRIKLSDPSGVIALAEVDTYSDLPTSPASQTAYRNNETGIYYKYDTDLADWESIDLLVADSVLNTMLESNDVNTTVRRAINIVLAGLYSRRQIVKDGTGAESTEYQSLSTLITLYNSLKAAYKEESAETATANTGRIVQMTRPSVGGFYE